MLHEESNAACTMAGWDKACLFDSITVYAPAIEKAVSQMHNFYRSHIVNMVTD